MNTPDAHQDRHRRAARCRGTAVRVADDGELLFRGGQVFAGYWRQRGGHRRGARRDGWFHTGDLGEIDDEGFVRITGRKKEILVTAGGKNVAPAVLEDRLRAHPLVSQCIVVGDGSRSSRRWSPSTPRCCRPGPGTTASSGLTVDEARTHEDMRAEIQAAVDDANKAVSQAESIRRFAILPGRLHRGGRPAHPQPQAQAQRRHEGLRRRGRGPLQRPPRVTSTV